MKLFSQKLIIAIIAIVFVNTALAQTMEPPYTARAYWIEKNREHYLSVKEKQLNAAELTENEEMWVRQYEKYLTTYFDRLSQSQQIVFKNNEASWNTDAGITIWDRHDVASREVVKSVPDSVAVTDASGRDMNLLIRHIGYSGISGASYGVMLNGMIEGENVGVPIIMAGGGMVLPLILPQYEDINNGSLWLRAHGKLMGAGSGLAVSMTLFGNNFANYSSTDWNGEFRKGYLKQTLGLTMAASIAGGAWGFYLGKNKGWSDGRISLYRHYSILGPAFFNSFLLAAENENARHYGITSILASSAGTYVGHVIANNTNFTRGDLYCTTGLALIGAGLGGGIIGMQDDPHIRTIIVPAVGGVAGSLVSHRMLKGARLSRSEGRRVNLAASAGALLGLGTVVLVEPDNFGPYLLVPSLGALGGFSLSLEYFKRTKGMRLGERKHRNSYFDVSYNFMPENLLLGKVMNYDRPLPLFNIGIKIN